MGRFAFEYAVSLGGWCQISHQIDRRGYQVGPELFFDHVLIPLGALHRALECGVDEAGFDAEPLRDTARGAITGLGYHHEYERHPDGTVILEGNGDVNARLRRRFDRFKALNGKRLLLVRRGGWNPDFHIWQDLRESAPIAAETIDRTAALLRAFLPDTEFRIAWLSIEGHTEVIGEPADSSIDLYRLPMASPSAHYSEMEKWKGNDVQWDWVFDRYAQVHAGALSRAA